MSRTLVVVDAETANLEVIRWFFETERAHLEPYAGTVVTLNALSRSVPTPIESLQHALSSYDALVVNQ